MANREMLSKNKISLIIPLADRELQALPARASGRKPVPERGIPGVIGAVGGENEGGNP